MLPLTIPLSYFSELTSCYKNYKTVHIQSWVLLGFREKIKKQRTVHFQLLHLFFSPIALFIFKHSWVIYLFIVSIFIVSVLLLEYKHHKGRIFFLSIWFTNVNSVLAYTQCTYVNKLQIKFLFIREWLCRGKFA